MVAFRGATPMPITAAIVESLPSTEEAAETFSRVLSYKALAAGEERTDEQIGAAREEYSRLRAAATAAAVDLEVATAAAQTLEAEYGFTEADS
ncbi:MAG: hypothetical protein JWM60_1665 [Solirubrobacterales bacterium]|nr:hypothetical protein [Solirubrobacterales bacterium]